MALTFPSLQSLVGSASAEIRKRIPSVDPTIFSSWAGIFVNSSAISAFSLVPVLRDLERMLFPQTATGSFLELWAGWEGLQRLAATNSTGNIVQPAPLSTVIPLNTLYRTSGGEEFSTTEAQSAEQISNSVISLTRSGTTATATTSADHNLATGLNVTISGSLVTEYNGEFEIVVTGHRTFTYEIQGSPVTPATGTIVAETIAATIPVRSNGTGSSLNVAASSSLSLSSTIAGVSSSALVPFDGLTGGTDEETDALLRARVLLSRSTLEGVFTERQIRQAALSVNGNTRVFVVRPTLNFEPRPLSVGVLPAPGQVVVYFLRDNDQNIIPSQTVINQTKQAIIENGRLPAHVPESNLGVFAPNLKPVDFSFASISPDTSTMRSAVQSQIEAFFEDQVEFEQDLDNADYLGAINNTRDSVTGQVLESFSLSSPIGKISVDRGEIASSGSVSFA